jgi:hypothetical protein
MFEKIIEIICWPWKKYKAHRTWKKRIAELRKRDPFIYK